MLHKEYKEWLRIYNLLKAKKEAQENNNEKDQMHRMHNSKY